MARVSAIGACALVVMLAPAIGAEVPAYDSNGTAVLARVLDDASVANYHGRISEAIAKDSDVIQRSPNYGAAYLQRAQHYMAAGRYDEAEADLKRVTAMHPDSAPLEVEWVRLNLFRGDAAKAIAAIKVAISLPSQSYWHAPYEGGWGETGSGHHFNNTVDTAALLDAYGSIAALLQGKNDAALADMDEMLKVEVTQPWNILNTYCYTAAVVGQLDMAELTCQDSISRNSHDTGQYDSLGFTHLRMKQWAKAVADYNTAINNRPDLTLSLYGRGIAKRALGDKAGGDADIAAATRDEPDIANIMKRLGAPSA